MHRHFVSAQSRDDYVIILVPWYHLVDAVDDQIVRRGLKELPKLTCPPDSTPMQCGVAKHQTRHTSPLATHATIPKRATPNTPPPPPPTPAHSTLARSASAGCLASVRGPAWEDWRGSEGAALTCVAVDASLMDHHNRKAQITRRAHLKRCPRAHISFGSWEAATPRVRGSVGRQLSCSASASPASPTHVFSFR